MNDAFTTAETTAIGAGLSLFNDNGSGVDTVDVDGPALSDIGAAVTGGTVGTQFTLPSGAVADGQRRRHLLAYDPNHAFDNLHLADAGSGAANTSTTDTFTYTLTGRRHGGSGDDHHQRREQRQHDL